MTECPELMHEKIYNITVPFFRYFLSDINCVKRIVMAEIGGIMFQEGLWPSDEEEDDAVLPHIF